MIRPIIRALPDAIKGIAEAIANNTPELIAGVVDLIFMLCQELPNILITIGQALPGALQAIFDGLINNLPQLIAGVVLLVLRICQRY